MLPVKGINNISNDRSRAVDCLLMKPTRRLTNIRLTIGLKVEKRWGHRDLNPAWRVSSSEPLLRFASLAESRGSVLQLVINYQQTHSSSFPCNWSPQYYQAILYPQGVCTKKRSALCLASCTSSPSQFLLAPFPALIAGLLPRTASSLHGERLADQQSVYDSIGSTNLLH